MMRKRNKLILIALGVLFVGGFVFAYANAKLFQGRIFEQPLIPANYGCFDKDEKDFYEKGVTYGIVDRRGFGKESDVCVGRFNLKEYYCEGKEKEVQSMQYTCENGCSDGACEKAALISLESMLTDPIPEAWLNKIKNDFSVSFLVYIPELNEMKKKEDADALDYQYDQFTTTEQELLKQNFYRTVYAASMLDSYFTKKLPWTDGEDYYDWVEKSVDNIYFHPGSISSGGDGEVFLSGKIALENINSGAAKSWKKDGMNLGFLQSFITIFNHEVRHSNNKDHIECNDFQGYDESLEYMGSNGVNILFIYWINNFLPPVFNEELDSLTSSGSLNIDAYLASICSFDYDGYIDNGFQDPNDYLSESDQDWLISSFGYPLK